MRNPKVYIAARWVDGARAQEVAVLCHIAGLRVASTWLGEWREDEPALTPAQTKSTAQADFLQIIMADAVLLVASTTGERERGGRLCELGVALGAGIPVFLLGEEPNPNVFHALCIPVAEVAEVARRLKNAPDFEE